MRKFTAAARFAIALRQAIHDLDHESRARGSGVPPTHADSYLSRGTLVHYWDTDCVYWPAFGFRGYRDDHAQTRRSAVEAASEDRLVQALFSAGFLGHVALIGPHRNEFAVLLNGYINHQVNGGDDRRHLRRFVREQGLSDLMSSFVAAANEVRCPNDGSALRAAVEQLALLDRSAFVHVEGLAGTWASRLHKLVKEDGLLIGSAPTPSLQDIVGDPLFARFSEALTNERDLGSDQETESSRLQRRSRFDRSAQTAADAAALCAIAMLNRRGGIFPRFYSASPAIRRVLENHDWAREAFSYHFTTRRGRDVDDTVFRDSYYYFVRAAFPALRRPGSETRGPQRSPDLQELRDLSRVLNDTLLIGAADLEKTVESWRFTDGRSAGEVIAEMEGSAMGLIWLHYPIEPVVREVVEGARAVVSLADLEQSEDIAFALLVDAESTLRNNMSDLALQLKLTRAIHQRVRHVRLDAGGTLRFDPDLASPVWGIVGDPDPGIGLKKHDLHDLLRFNDIAALRESPEAADRAMTIAVGLECFGLANCLANTLTDGSGRISEATWIMGYTARLRSLPPCDIHSSTCDIQREWKLLRSAWEQLSSDEQPRLCLAYAEAAYRLWRRGRFAALGLGAGVALSVVERWPADPLGIGAWGLARVVEHLDLVAEYQRAFALELVFRSVIALRVDDYEHPEHLAEVRSDPRSNGHRRLALLGYEKYLSCVRALPLESSMVETLTARDAPSLVEAAELLDEALEAAPHDSDTCQYRRSLREFRQVVQT